MDTGSKLELLLGMGGGCGRGRLLEMGNGSGRDDCNEEDDEDDDGNDDDDGNEDNDGVGGGIGTSEAESGAGLSHASQNGKTALFWNVQSDRIESVRMLKLEYEKIS
jgi:hypothetical protein